MQLLKQKTIRWISLLCIVALSATQMFRETPDAQGAVPDGNLSIELSWENESDRGYYDTKDGIVYNSDGSVDFTALGYWNGGGLVWWVDSEDRGMVSWGGYDRIVCWLTVDHIPEGKDGVDVIVSGVRGQTEGLWHDENMQLYGKITQPNTLFELTIRLDDLIYKLDRPEERDAEINRLLFKYNTFDDSIAGIEAEDVHFTIYSITLHKTGGPPVPKPSLPSATATASAVVKPSAPATSSPGTGRITPSPAATAPTGGSGLKMKKFQIQTNAKRQAVLKWESVKGASAYRIYRSGKAKKGYRLLREIPATRHTYTDTPPKIWKKYYYKIAAVRSGDGGNYEGKKSQAVSFRGREIRTPTISVRKGARQGIRYLTVSLKKYEGTYVDIYVATGRKKYRGLKLASHHIRKYKGKFKIQYVVRKTVIRLKVRTYKKKKKKKIYSDFSKESKIRVDFKTHTPRTGRTERLNAKKLTIHQKEARILKVKDAKKKIKWRIVSGKKYISLKGGGRASIKVVGKKTGKARVQAKGKKKLICKVTVQGADKSAGKSKTPSARTNAPQAVSSPKPVGTAQPGTQAPTGGGTRTTAKPTATPPRDANGRNTEDVAAVKKLIAEQKERGACVSEDLGSEEYIWSDKGDLVGIVWGDLYTEFNLSGSISFAGLKNLRQINVNNNRLTSLDTRENHELELLNCNNNYLDSLDVGRNPVLRELRCSNNNLSSLDAGGNSSLKKLCCDENRLNSLEVSGNPALKELDCNANQLSSLSVSRNPALESLNCESNQLDSLDVSKNPMLKTLFCDHNQLYSLDVSRNHLLGFLCCGYNYLSSLDVRNNLALWYLSFGNNQLSSVDVSENSALEQLYCESNQLSSLDVSRNPALEQLYCESNQLSSLDVSQNPALEWFKCADNQLSSLDVSRNLALEYLYCQRNQLSSLDVSNNPVLGTLWCQENRLSNLDVSKNSALRELWCYQNRLSNLDVSNNLALTALKCQKNQLSNLDVSHNLALRGLYCDKGVTVVGCSDNIICWCSTGS